VKPLILLAGYSAYPRRINCRRMREIADQVGAVLMVDMAHFAGLVAGGVFVEEDDPIPFAHVVTATTHKTLRGPRGGLVLCTEEFAESVDKGCPLVIGGPLPHVMAAKAVAFAEALTPDFHNYARRVVENARALAAASIREGMSVVTGGTDNHLLLIDVCPFGLTGRQAESALRECGITLNRNALPLDPHGPWYTSGLRIGTAAVTSLGMAEGEMAEIAALIRAVLADTAPLGSSRAKYTVRPQTVRDVRERVAALLERFPVYPQLDLPFLQAHFALTG